jgi:HlyD family secretion protein
MNKWIVIVALLLLGGGGWYIARQQRFVPLWEQPKFGKVARDDIRVPITAAGLIHPQQAIELKPKASGRIMEVPVVEGDFVRTGQPVVVLDPQDEQRTLDRAQADFDRAGALLTQAKLAVERAAVGIETAKSRLEEIAAQGRITSFQAKKVRDLNAKGQASDQDVNDAQAQDQINHAQQDSARIAIRSAELALEDAKATVISQQATLESAQKTLEDAQQRLRETTVLAPTSAIVTQVYVKPGMLVQSATQGFTGGTPLMNIADVTRKEVIAKLDEADYGRVLNVSPLTALPDMPELRATAEQDAERMARRSGVVRVTVDAFPDQSFEGRIVRVEPQGKLNAGSSIIQFDVHVEITDAQRHILPLGAQAQVEFTVESATHALIVPADAVKTHEEQRGVWLKITGENGDVGKRFVACRFGISDGDRTQVIEVLNGAKLDEGVDVYTKLPQTDDERR